MFLVWFGGFSKDFFKSRWDTSKHLWVSLGELSNLLHSYFLHQSNGKFYRGGQHGHNQEKCYWYRHLSRTYFLLTAPKCCSMLYR